MSASAAGEVLDSPLARYVPKPKPAGKKVSHSEANKGDWEYKAFVTSVKILYHHRDLARDCRDFLLEAVADKKRKTEHGPDAAEEVSTLAFYDPVWIAKFVCEKMEISLTTLGKALAKDPAFAVHCAAAILNCSVGLIFPASCKNPAVMTEVGNERAKAVDNRAVLLMHPEPVIDVDGVINWRGGLYEEEAGPDGMVIALIHRPTSHRALVEADLNINVMEYTIEHNYDDMKAAFFKSTKQRYECCEFFGDKRGPHLVPQWRGKCKPFKEAAYAKAAKIIAARAASSTSVVEEQKALYTPRKDEQSAKILSGKEKLKKAQLERERKRRAVMISPPTAGGPAVKPVIASGTVTPPTTPVSVPSVPPEGVPPEGVASPEGVP